MRGLREPGDGHVVAVPDEDGAPARLRGAVVGGVEDAEVEGVVLEELPGPGGGQEVPVLGRLPEGGHVLHDEVLGPGPLNDLGVLLPEPVAGVLRVPLAERAEPLARGTADDDVDAGGDRPLGEPVLDGARVDIRLGEGRAVGGGGLRVHLDCGDAAEARRRRVEARGETSRPGEEVEDADGAGSHGIRVAGRYDTESRLTVSSRV